jgi:hypothetical protein
MRKEKRVFVVCLVLAAIFIINAGAFGQNTTMQRADVRHNPVNSNTTNTANNGSGNSIKPRIRKRHHRRRKGNRRHVK